MIPSILVLIVILLALSGAAWFILWSLRFTVYDKLEKFSGWLAVLVIAYMAYDLIVGYIEIFKTLQP